MLQILRFCFFLMLIMISLPVCAEVSYDAQVKVQVEDENAAVAKDKALKKAVREAFLQVASRMTAAPNVQKLDALTDDQLQHFVREVSVVSEKNGVKSYQADLQVKINGNLLKMYMQENEMLQMVNVASKVLIIPVFSDTLYAEKVLWEDGNVWRQVWLSKGLIKSGSFDFAVIADNSLNRMALTVDDAVTLNRKTYDKLVGNNGIKDIYVVDAVRAEDGTLLVLIKTMNGAEKRLVITGDSGDLFEKAIAETVAYITSAMYNHQAEESRHQGELTAAFKYSRLKDWLDIEKRLKSVAQIQKVETVAVGNGQIQLKISYSGSEQRLIRTLYNAKIFMQNYNGQYILVKGEE